MAAFDPKLHLPLSPALWEVLVALADGDKHGYAIGKEVTRRTNGEVTLRATTLYSVLKRALEDGLIEETRERPDPALDDERRRYYRLTDRGRKVAVAESERLTATLKQARVKLFGPQIKHRLGTD
jgi:DNA-binding PadR family transcriptional regulator